MDQNLSNRPFVFVRHGSTDWSFEQLHKGILDLSLNAKGIKDVQATATRLIGLKNPMLISSPKKRTLETASIISKTINSLITMEPGLDARYYGNFFQNIEMCKKFQVALDQNSEDPLLESLLPKDAESKEVFDKRVIESLKSVMSHFDFLNHALIIVSHGEVYASLCRTLCEKELSINKGDCRFFSPPQSKQHPWLIHSQF